MGLGHEIAKDSPESARLVPWEQVIYTFYTFYGIAKMVVYAITLIERIDKYEFVL